MTRAFIGLGSNVGDRLACMRKAVSALRELGLVRVSSVYETRAVGPPQPDFLNAAASLETSLTARALLVELKRIEASVGRIARGRWGPREIDLDLLLYDDERTDEGDLVVPHPELAKRGFVLVPLVELAPDARLPAGQSLAGLLQSLDTTDVRPFAGGDWAENDDGAHRNV